MKNADSLYLLIIVTIACLVIIVTSISSMFRSSKPDMVAFNVTGVVSGVNASTVTSLHLECIKFCSDKFKGDGYNTLQSCYVQCASLGKEVVCNGTK